MVDAPVANVILKTKLKNGKIPKGMVCPVKDQCPMIFRCFHRGVEHECDFSCGMARGLVIATEDNRMQPETGPGNYIGDDPLPESGFG